MGWRFRQRLKLLPGVWVNLSKKGGSLFVGGHGTTVVIKIPSGLKTPVVCKSDLIDNGKSLLRENDIYVRTVATNGTISCARGNAVDIAELVGRCFENREADQNRSTIESFSRHS